MGIVDCKDSIFARHFVMILSKIMYTKEIVLSIPVPRLCNLFTNLTGFYCDHFISLQNVYSHLNQTCYIFNLSLILMS